jgi:hypothetical protein
LGKIETYSSNSRKTHVVRIDCMKVRLMLVYKAKGYIHNLRRKTMETLYPKTPLSFKEYGIYKERPKRPKTIAKLYKEKTNYLISPLGISRWIWVLHNRSSLGIFSRRLLGLGLLYSLLGMLYRGIIVDFIDACSIRHLFSA